ncbi:hypothetical protein EXIGLDRAFT_763304 [Exidia glandulosa HHB12029]|uniref:Uncharacterized protein n=1 Tax=Exidia glandulosa HHB12029 TaxID=1314781 RepID=A0A165M178_EXIGL|nr:hypothetical protein EXIGLDRAFT_763304 [Exidia glandulosa HHB12029]
MPKHLRDASAAWATFEHAFTVVRSKLGRVLPPPPPRDPLTLGDSPRVRRLCAIPLPVLTVCPAPSRPFLTRPGPTGLPPLSQPAPIPPHPPPRVLSHPNGPTSTSTCTSLYFTTPPSTYT